MYINNSNECGHCDKKFNTERLLRNHLDIYAGHCAKSGVYDHFDEHPEEEDEINMQGI